jgi:hypothetical protein
LPHDDPEDRAGYPVLFATSAAVSVLAVAVAVMLRVPEARRPRQAALRRFRPADLLQDVHGDNIVVYPAIAFFALKLLLLSHAAVT